MKKTKIRGGDVEGDVGGDVEGDVGGDYVTVNATDRGDGPFEPP